MQFNLEEFIPSIWEDIAIQLADAGEVVPHGLVGNTEAAAVVGLGHVQLSAVPKDVYRIVLSEAVKHMDADFVVVIHEAWMRKSNVADVGSIPTKLVGTWPNVERVTDTSGMEAIDSVVVSYVAKGSIPVVETMTVKTDEGGRRTLEGGSLRKIEPLTSRFLDGLFPPPPSKVH